MRTVQQHWTESDGWSSDSTLAADVVVVFGSRNHISDERRIAEIRERYPDTHLIGCSTAGEIRGVGVYDDSLVLTAIEFEHTAIVGAEIELSSVSSSREAGQKLAAKLPTDGLTHVFVLSDGVSVNGSELVSGLTDSLPEGVTLTGGLSGDGADFDRTVVLTSKGPVGNAVTALGLYGDRLRVGYGSLGGWDPFGPERLITRSAGNVLYELDGKSALDLYKRYLGEHASGLPATGLLFPLALRAPDCDAALVRTILSVDDSDSSMTFAGDVPEGWFARLMHANFDRLVDGAHGAARSTVETLGAESPDLALLISCVGRKMVLKQRIEDEVEAVRDVLGEKTTMTGFYSYGEISPLLPSARCELHNQTMTITTISER